MLLHSFETPVEMQALVIEKASSLMINLPPDAPYDEITVTLAGKDTVLREEFVFPFLLDFSIECSRDFAPFDFDFIFLY